MEWLDKELQAASEQSLLRSLTCHAPAPGRPGYLCRGDRVLLDLSSNDYLGLTQHPALIQAMQEALLTEGAGAGASRLVTGHRPRLEELERSLAEWQQSEAALVFASGYAANTGVIPALVGRGDIVLSDRWNHASIIDGILLSRAEHVRYRHRDLEQLDMLLSKHGHARRKLIVSDAIFSMDGDAADIKELVRLKNKYGAMLMIDEAHSGGVYGARGEGLCHSLGLHEEIDVHLGTFSKAFGVYGAYVTGSRRLIDWLVQKARSLVYSTALPGSVVAGVQAALRVVRQEHGLRERLTANGKRFRSRLAAAGFRVGEGDSPIVPVIVGGNETALRFSSMLEAEGIAAAAIRPPTVPAGTARLRCSLSAVHEEKDLLSAAEHMIRIGRQLEVIG